jgi:flagella basal body P-ring formation protein FlgA
VLMERLDESPQVSLDQVVNQQAARDIAIGSVLSGKMIQATPLARIGDLITVNVEQGRVRLKWVAEAREDGSYGQTIRARNPRTREEIKVTLVGPQEGRLVGTGIDDPGQPVAKAGGRSSINAKE